MSESQRKQEAHTYFFWGPSHVPTTFHQLWKRLHEIPQSQGQRAAPRGVGRVAGAGSTQAANPQEDQQWSGESLNKKPLKKSALRKGTS